MIKLAELAPAAPMRTKGPKCPDSAPLPSTFSHLTCSASSSYRRPVLVMRRRSIDSGAYASVKELHRRGQPTCPGPIKVRANGSRHGSIERWARASGSGPHRAPPKPTGAPAAALGVRRHSRDVMQGSGDRQRLNGHTMDDVFMSFYTTLQMQVRPGGAHSTHTSISTFDR